MPMMRYKPEQIVTLLRQIEVAIANGKTTPQACKEAQITAQSYDRWRKEYGGLKLDRSARTYGYISKQRVRLLSRRPKFGHACLVSRRSAGFAIDSQIVAARGKDS